MDNESSMGFEHFKYTLDAIKNATADKVKAEVMNEVANAEIVELRKEVTEWKLVVAERDDMVAARDAVIEAKDEEIARLREELAKRDGRNDVMLLMQSCIMLERLKLTNAFMNMRSMPKQAYVLGTTLSTCLPGGASAEDHKFMNNLLTSAGCSEKPGFNARDIFTDNATKIEKS